jgi:glycosyltransferase involved in cell wall biosynthesis
MRVTHVIHGLGSGGAEQVLVDLCGALGGLDVAVSVLSLMPLEGHGYAGSLRQQGIDVSTLALPSRWDIRGLRQVVTAIAQTSPDLIHTHMKHADLLGGLAARRLSVPQISTLHVIEDAPTPLGRFKRALASQARQRGAARTVAVSDAVRNWYLDAFKADPTRVVTIRNGRATPDMLSYGDRRRLRASVGIDDDIVVVAVVGIMRPGKGHAAVLEVARQLKKRNGPGAPTVRFVLAGDGPLRADLEQEARRSGAGQDVLFVGYRDDVPALLQASDVLLHASDFDALPTALIEGLAAGLPSVAYAVGGIPEIITAETGYLVEAGDVAALTAALVELVRDRDRRTELGEQASKRFAAEFDATTWATRMRDLYYDVLQTGKQR